MCTLHFSRPLAKLLNNHLEIKTELFNALEISRRIWLINFVINLLNSSEKAEK